MMAKRAAKSDSARALAIEAARIAHDDNAEDILVLDLRGISPVTEYFVIATGTSDRQLRAVADEIRQHAKAGGQPVWHVAGRDSGDWIVMDFVDVVVHLFEASKRSFYDLELIWGEAPHVRWERAARRASSKE
jgi:ribosome-associated protein